MTIRLTKVLKKVNLRMKVAQRPNNNLRIVTEEDLKKNKNALSDKE